ncbi:peptidylprolyl isomerase [Delftia sp. UME58]|uniref:peptidylprolyl isomerase n=1 Tax=Delftia sp. UME58 TaxID=1862322 RepID=UPI0016007D98|nr:peptidylprolyl isomerase [Delftia sp. UME58]MBB1651291.1 peptidylprolyl isomerase [Delftia sp. UME58]
MQVTKTSAFPLSRVYLALALAAGGLASVPARADEARLLMDGPATRITTADVNADAQRMPEDVRPVILSQPQQVQQIVSNLYVRRALADDAEKQGLGKTPEVLAVLRLARDKVLSDAWIEQVRERSRLPAQVAEAQARSLYNAKPERFEQPEQVQVRHILIAGDTPESKAKAGELLAQLKAGADFAELAKANSADKGSGAKGGDLGYFGRGRMVPEFDKVAFALDKPGALSDLVKTQFGYHILRLEARKPAGTRPYLEVREQLLAEVQDKVAQDAVTAQADKLRAAATPHVDAIRAFSEGVKKP